MGIQESYPRPTEPNGEVPVFLREAAYGLGMLLAKAHAAAGIEPPDFAQDRPSPEVLEQLFAPILEELNVEDEEGLADLNDDFMFGVAAESGIDLF